MNEDMQWAAYLHNSGIQDQVKYRGIELFINTAGRTCNPRMTVIYEIENNGNRYDSGM